jgi:hypothetical protein
MKDMEIYILMTIGAKIFIKSMIIPEENMQITDGLIKERLVNMSGKRGNGVHLV